MACEIVTVAVPEFVRVKFWEVLEAVLTLPKTRLVALDARDPEEAVSELDLAAGVPAPVRPTQPIADKASRRATQRRILAGAVSRIHDAGFV